MSNLSSNESASMKGALSGLQVLDLSRVLAGPWASQILGDLGANVIKIEHPKRGDDTRAWGPPFVSDGEDQPTDFSGYFLSCNRNKRSLAVDISKTEGADLIRKLALESDIVIENFKVGGLKKYGLDYDSLKCLKPSLIYCSITGFGQEGPYSPRGGYDFLIQGMSGLMSVIGQPEGKPGSEPLKVGIPISDLVTGLYAVISILAAHRYQECTGVGQHIDCALFDTQIALLGNQAMNWLVGDILPKPMGNGHPNVVPYRNFPTCDGHVIVACGNDSQFQSLCRMLGREDIAEEPRYQNNAARVKHRDELEAAIGESTSTWSSKDLMAAMVECGVPGGPINRINEVFEDPHVVAREVVQHIETDNGTSLPLVRFPSVFSETPASYRYAPPHVGQHTDDLLREELGLDVKQIAELRRADVIR